MIQNLDSLIKSFNDESSQYDSETNTFHHLVSEYVILQNLLHVFNNNRDALILDSGGGTGKFALLLNKLGYNIELIDCSQKSIEIAQDKFLINNQSIRTSEQNSEHTNYADNTFDYVMLNGAVLSYTPNPEQVIRETHRILKKNGIIIFDFFNTIGWAIEIKDPEESYKIMSSDNYHIKMADWTYPAHLMSIPHMEKMLTNNGYTLLSKKGLISITHTFPLEFRYSKDYSLEMVKKYQNIELYLSNRDDCVGTSWSCIMCGKKIN